MDKLKNCSILLLSAGSGSRMGKLTQNTPKSILKVGNTTPLDFLIKKLIMRGVNEINIVLGFQYKKILKKLKKYKKLKVNYLIIKNIINYGSVWSLYKSFNLLKKKKYKFVLMFHTDLIFDGQYLDNIIKSKKKDIIGVKSSSKESLNMKSFVAQVNKSMKILKIGKLWEVKEPYGEIICINKFSRETFKKFNYFLKNYFKNHTKNITWEYPISKFSEVSDLYILKKQNYKWININTKRDLTLAHKMVA